MEAYLEGNEPDVATLKKLIRKGTLNFSFVPVLCGSAFKNKGVQPLLDAVVDYLPSPLDVPPIEGIKPDTRPARDPRAVGRRAVLGAGVQDHERPVRRHADLRPHLFGQARDRVAGHELGQGQEGKGRPHAADACQRPRGHPGRLRRRHRRAGRSQGHHHRRYFVRRQCADHPRADGIPRSGHRGRGRAQDQGRPGEDGRRAQPPGPRGPVVPRYHRP